MSDPKPDNPFLWDADEFYAWIHEAYGEPPPLPIFWPAVLPLLPDDMLGGKTWGRLPDLHPPVAPQRGTLEAPAKANDEGADTGAYRPSYPI